jgi:hypothetical protein
MSKSRADPAFEISSGDVLILPERHPACRRREPQPGTRMERANLRFDDFSIYFGLSDLFFSLNMGNFWGLGQATWYYQSESELNGGLAIA